ncbi:MAG TPA: tetratricopeptide repeat protein [Longimicrobium sp.]|nr:tetratricopeptide repeat protein [Longimicrobium sp.]
MPDLSPELAARIQSLEASFEQNRGRYFVALAGAWREAGEPARAEQILRDNVGKFPGLSAHVLLGRCLADRGAFQEAANEFHYVLSIDSQNLIALRTLAEMAAGQGRRDEAERWYRELLQVDPMNAEARAALEGLAQAGADASTADQPLPVGSEWPGAAEQPPAAAPAGADDGFGLVDLDLSPVSGPAEGGDGDEAPGGWGDIRLDPEPASADAGSAGDAGGWGEITLDAPADAGAAGDEGGWGGLPVEAAAPAPEDDGGWGELAPDAGSSVGDEAPAGAEAGQGGGPLGGDFDALGFGAVDLDAQPAGAGDWLDGDARQDPGESAAADAGAGAPELPHHHGEDDHEMVTETMAELYASQGLHDRAADVYRELIQQRGPEPELVRRLGEIEARLQAARAGDEAPGEPQPAAAASADPFADSFAGGFEGGDEQASPVAAPQGAEAEAAVAADWAAAAAPLDEPPAPPAPAPAGRSLRDYFATLLQGRIAAPPPPAPAEAPSPAEAGAPEPAAEAEPTPEEVAGPENHPWALADAPPPAEDEPAPAAEAGDEGMPWALEPPGFRPDAPAEPEQPAAADDEPWAGSSPEPEQPAASADDEPWAASAPSPEPEAPAAPAEGSPFFEDEPWAAAPQPEQPAAAADEGPLDIGALSFEPLAPPETHGRGVEVEAPADLLPWEMSPQAAETPVEPAPPAPAGGDIGGGFSFEDFFAAPPAPAPAAPQPAAAAPPSPPPPPPPAPAPAPAPAASAAPAAPGGGDEDEDLESFQAWLQSLKR